MFGGERRAEKTGPGGPWSVVGGPQFVVGTIYPSVVDSHAMKDGETIDVGAILAQLRAEVRAAHGTADDQAAHQVLGVDPDELRESVAEVEALRAVSAHWPIQGRTPRERVIGFVQRIVRRALQWYIQPIVQQQNSFNAAVTRSLQLLLDAELELAQEVARLREANATKPGEPTNPA